MLREGRRQRRWWWCCWRLTLVLPRRRTGCARNARTTYPELRCTACVHTRSHSLAARCAAWEAAAALCCGRKGFRGSGWGAAGGSPGRCQGEGQGAFTASAQSSALSASVHTRSHLLAAALRRLGTSRCTLLRQGRRRRRWLGRSWRLILALPRRVTRCAHRACATLGATFHRLRAYMLSYARRCATQNFVWPPFSDRAVQRRPPLDWAARKQAWEPASGERHVHLPWQANFGRLQANFPANQKYLNTGVSVASWTVRSMPARLARREWPAHR